MVDKPPVGLQRLRVSFDRVPVDLPAVARTLPGPMVLPIFAAKIPEMVIPYADAAAYMLANLDRGGEMSFRRIGLALPRGMRGHKWPGIAPIP